MGRIPQDAIHNQSGARNAPAAPAWEFIPMLVRENDARLLALHTRLRKTARAYHDATGEHLPIWRELARVHAALHCDVPLEPLGGGEDALGVEILSLPPHARDLDVEVDLTKSFATLIVVRISNDFDCDARMIPRRALPPAERGLHRICWTELPHRF